MSSGGNLGPDISPLSTINDAEKPGLSQYWVRKVNKQAFGGITPDKGYGGHDEDQGQMGGVSALMSLGLFSLQGTNAAKPVYDITSPVFDEITIKLDPKYYSGKQFIIKTYNNSEANCYIQKAVLNGKALNTFWFLHQDFAKGGLLEIWLGPKPDKKWGVAGLPPSNNKQEVHLLPTWEDSIFKYLNNLNQFPFYSWKNDFLLKINTP